MKKTLIKKEDLDKYICGKEFFVEEEMILAPSAKDFLREKGIRIQYDKKVKTDECLETKVIKILKESYGITDHLIVKKIMRIIGEMN